MTQIIILYQTFIICRACKIAYACKYFFFQILYLTFGGTKTIHLSIVDEQVENIECRLLGEERRLKSIT